MDESKTCTKCFIEKPVTEFYQRSKDRASENYRRETWCKRCTQDLANRWRRENPERFNRTRRARHLRKHYGITLDDYDRMLSDQGGKCLGCGSETSGPDGHPLVVDHDHRTGRVRELLCSKCNLVLGNALDNPEVLRALADYLDRHHAISASLEQIKEKTP